MCVIYVDDKILAGPDSKALEEVIKSIGFIEEEQRHTFELRDEGKVGDFWYQNRKDWFQEIYSYSN